MPQPQKVDQPEILPDLHQDGEEQHPAPDGQAVAFGQDHADGTADQQSHQYIPAVGADEAVADEEGDQHLGHKEQEGGETVAQPQAGVLAHGMGHGCSFLPYRG